MNRILLIRSVFFLLMCLGGISSYSATVTSLNVPGLGCLNTNVSVTATGQRDAACSSSGTTETLSVTNGPAGGSMIVTENADNDKVFRFTKPGTYTITYTFSDNPNCAAGSIASESAFIVIFDDPSASFVSSSVNVCSGDEVTITLTKDPNTTVTVERESTGNTVPVTGNSFTLPNIIDNDVLRIIRVRMNEGPNCLTEGENIDQINVNVIARPDTIRSMPMCNDDNTELIIQYTLSGGQPPYSVISGPGTLSGNVLTTDLIPIDQEFTFQIDMGAACGVYEFTDRDICDCLADAGNMDPEPLFSCANGFATAEHQGAFTANGIERLFFILHESADDSLRGNEIFWSENPTFAFNPEKMEYDKEYYISSAVAPFVNDTFQRNARCFDISAGVSVTWLADNQFSINGRDQVCQNEDNVIFKADGDLIIGTTSDWEVKGNAEELPIAGENSQKTYVSFENSNGGDIITLTYETAVKFANVEETCIVRDSLKVLVKNEVALEKSNVVSWPGNIFASTEDLESVCYQWGYTDQSNFQEVMFPGETNKIFFMDLTGEQSFATIQSVGVLWVATFTDANCDINNAECVTYNYFNSDIPPGLSESDLDDFSVDLYPNPNNGQFRLDIKGAFRGNYNMSVYNNIGHKVKEYSIDKEYVRAIRDYNFSDLSEGLHYIVIRNEFGKDQIIKTIITR